MRRRRKRRKLWPPPPLTEGQILAWADAHFAAHREWPTCRCPEQAIPGTGGERWFNVDQTLRKGLRGLPGGSSLPTLLARHRGVPNLKASMTSRILRRPARRADPVGLLTAERGGRAHRGSSA